MLSRFERWMLDRLIKKVVRQDYNHDKHITSLYGMIYRQAEKTFYEDNRPTLDSFMDECYAGGKQTEV